MKLASPCLAALLASAGCASRRTPSPRAAIASAHPDRSNTDAPMDSPLIDATASTFPTDGDAAIGRVTSDFSLVFDHCAGRLALRRSGEHTLAVSLGGHDGNATLALARWDDAQSRFVDIQRIGPFPFSSNLDAAEVTFAPAADAIELAGGCAPDLETPGAPMECETVRIERRADTWRIAHPARRIRRGLVSPEQVRRRMPTHPMLRRFAQTHPGCALESAVTTVRGTNGALAFAVGCPSATYRAACTTGCVVVWQAPSHPVEVVRSDPVAVLETASGVLVVSNEEGGHARADRFDVSGHHAVVMPVASTQRAVTDRSGSVWLEADDVVYVASAPDLSWQRACPFEHCHIARGAEIGSTPWLVDPAATPAIRLARRDPSGNWEARIWSAAHAEPSDVWEVIADANATWLRVDSSGTSSLYRLGPAPATECLE